MAIYKRLITIRRHHHRLTTIRTKDGSNPRVLKVHEKITETKLMENQKHE